MNQINRLKSYEGLNNQSLFLITTFQRGLLMNDAQINIGNNRALMFNAFSCNIFYLISENSLRVLYIRSINTLKPYPWNQKMIQICNFLQGNHILLIQYLLINQFQKSLKNLHIFQCHPFMRRYHRPLDIVLLIMTQFFLIFFILPDYI